MTTTDGVVSPSKPMAGKRRIEQEQQLAVSDEAAAYIAAH
jgi:hypothetical protein